MSNGAIVGGVELAKLILQLYFAYMEQQNKTAEESEALYQSEGEKFKENRPESLPDL